MDWTPLAATALGGLFVLASEHGSRKRTATVPVTNLEQL